MYILALLLFQAPLTESQNNWIGGGGVLGPVSHWGTQFYQSDQMLFTIENQISPIATSWNYDNWTKHVIDTDNGITGHTGIFPADFDKDGDYDLAGWLPGKDEIRIYKNEFLETGNKTFTRVKTLTGPTSNNGTAGLIYCADIDGDGDMDILVPVQDIWWFENTGGFNFIGHKIEDLRTDGTVSYSSGAVADVDNDGDMDFVIGRRIGSNPKIEVFTRNNNDTTYTKWSRRGAYWRVNLKDINGDGYIDLAVANGRGYVYLNDSTGKFNEVWHTSLGGGDGVSINDFDNDGDNDVLFGHQWTDYEPTYWYENVNGDASEFEAHEIWRDPNRTGRTWGDAAYATDMDMDGRVDVVSGLTSIGYFRQNDSGEFDVYTVDNHRNSHWIYAVNLDRTFGVCGDYDKDVDILISDYNSGHQFAWYENKVAQGYVASASLQSSVFEITENLQWYYIGWEACVPSGSSTKFYVRSSNDVNNMGDYLGGYSAQIGEYRDSVNIGDLQLSGKDFQYKIEMTTDEQSSPVVYEVFAIAGVDVGPTKIAAPSGCLETKPITPAVVIHNFSVVEVTTMVYVEVSSLDGTDTWNDARQVTIAPLSDEYVEFSTFEPKKGLAYNFKYFTKHDRDVNVENDAIAQIFYPCDAKFDFGDAPDPPYPSLLANDGARHGVNVPQLTWLGDIAKYSSCDCVPDTVEEDPEVDAWDEAGGHEDSPNPIVEGDDGIIFYYPYIPNQVCSLDVMISTPGKSALTEGEKVYFAGWIDWNFDGEWTDDGEWLKWLKVKKIGPDEGEYVDLNTYLLESDPTTWNSTCQIFRLTFMCNSEVSDTGTWGRFRLCYGEEAQTVKGEAPTGEVEDYHIFIGTSGIEENNDVTIDYIRPNPFVSTTEILYSIKSSENITISVFDNLGRLVKLLINNKVQAGTHKIVWDGKDSKGNKLSTGIYYIVIRKGTQTKAIKAVIVR